MRVLDAIDLVADPLCETSTFNRVGWLRTKTGIESPKQRIVVYFSMDSGFRFHKTPYRIIRFQ